MSNVLDSDLAGQAETRDLLRALAIFCVAVALVRAAVPWAIAVPLHPHEDPGVRVMYTTSIDAQYLPQIAAGAQLNFGESELYESYGQGLKSFPFASTLPYSFCYALFGWVGFPLIEAVVSVLMLILVATFLRKCGVARAWSWLGGLLYISTYAEVVRFLGLRGWSVPIPFALWSTRGPRPFLTDLYVFGTLILLLRVCGPELRATRFADWAGVGLGIALLLQSDLYSAITVGSVAGIVVLWQAARPTSGGRSFGASAARTGVLAAVIAVAAWPFVVQRLHEHPDIPARFGLFKYPDPRPPFLGAGDWVWLGVAWLAAGLLAVCQSPESPPATRYGPWLLGVLCTVSFFALPFVTGLTGKLIQIHQFRDRFLAFTAVTFLAALLAVGRWLTCRFVRRPSRVVLTLILAASALNVAIAAARGWVKAHYTHSPRLQTPALPNYRHDLDALAQEFAKPEYADCRVLGTLDYETDLWWSTFRGRIYLPDAFITNAPDADLERRYATFFKIVGAGEDQFIAFLRDPVKLFHWLGALKYQVNVYYSHAPLDRLLDPPSPEELESTTYGFPQVRLSRDAERRLRELFRACDPNLASAPRLDLIVLPNSPDTRDLAPPTDQFEPAYQNESFRAYRRRGR
jgi:hypothetical protein